MFRLSRTFIAPLLLLFSASLFAAAETKPAAPADLDLVLFWIKAVPCPVLNRTPSVVITPFLPKTVKEGNIYVTTVLFNHENSTLHNREPISKVKT